jgi:hypothetical protein
MTKPTTPTQARVAQLKRYRLIPLLVVVVIGAVTACHSKASGGELVLTAATEPGANAFMPPAASPPPTNTQPQPTLQSQGDGNTVETQPVHGDRDGLYGGTDNNAGIDRDKIVGFYGANPTQAGGFVEALNSDPTVWWSGARRLTVADIPTYLRELTPALLRLDTRITNHGFDGTHPTTVQSVFQAGTAVLVDAHGVPRVRGLSGSPLTAPVALRGAPKLVGIAWPGYRSGALAEVLATTAAIANFVLVDVVTGLPFNRPVGTTGTGDTPHTQPVAPPQPGATTSAAPTTGQGPQLNIDGNYLVTIPSGPAGQFCSYPFMGHTETDPVTHQGNALTIGGMTGTLNADGSFSVDNSQRTAGYRGGVFATEGGHTVFHATLWNVDCTIPISATKQ